MKLIKYKWDSSALWKMDVMVKTKCIFFFFCPTVYVMYVTLEASQLPKGDSGAENSNEKAILLFALRMKPNHWPIYSVVSTFSAL